jgi:C4-dicarboxylate-specific signal transduction histidine kinase
MALVSDRRSLTAKLLIVYVPMVCVSAVAVSLVLEIQYYRTERAALVDGLDRLVALQHSALAAAAWEYDTDHVAALLADMEREPHLLSAVVLDESGRVLGQVGDVDSLPESPDLRLERELVFTTSGVSTTVGRLVAAFHTGEIWRDMRWHLLVTAAGLAAMASTLVLGTLIAVRVVIGRPISLLLQSIDRMKVDGVFEPVKWEGTDELSRVVDAYNEMQTKRAAAEAARRHAEEEARDRMAELALMNRRASAGEMTASIAHEIGQPLVAIVANADAGRRLLAKNPPDLEEASAAFEDIANDGHRAGGIVESIRALYRREGQDKGLWDINELVTDVLRLVGTELQRHQVSLRQALTEGLPLVQVDRVQLQQVVLNLVMNAAEAMELVSDRPRVLRISSEAVDGGRIRLTFEDSGPGINPGALDQVFQPFFTSKPRGMGMGLSISRSIVKAHGGRLIAIPGQDHGAVFQIELPSCRAPRWLESE